MKALSNPFFFKMEEGAEDYARKMASRSKYSAPNWKRISEHQVGIANNLISRGYGAIVIAPADSRKLAPLLAQAIAQGIVVINIDSPLDKGCPSPKRRSHSPSWVPTTPRALALA